jgi:putative addiction module component (TIGR02574 family)
MTIAQLTNEALALPSRERAMLAQQLWDSVQDNETLGSFLDEQTRAEIERRDAEMESGVVPGVPHNRAMEIIESSLRCK